MREAERYKAAYCGLCHSLAEEYGFCARFLVSYDMTLLSMLVSGLCERGDGVLCSHRCVASPFKKKQCLRGMAGATLAADVTVINAWWKLLDNLSDEKWYKKPAYLFAKLILRGKYEKAAARRQRLAMLTEDCMTELSLLEKSNCKSLDKTADCFGRQLAAIAAEVDEKFSPALTKLLYHLARIIYILDAMDDTEDDAKNGAYNAVVARFGSVGDDTKQELEFTLVQSLATVADCFDILPDGAYTELNRNILTLGMQSAIREVFLGEKKKRGMHAASKDEVI